jgi:hypothetical protein
MSRKWPAYPPHPPQKGETSPQAREGEVRSPRFAYEARRRRQMALTVLFDAVLVNAGMVKC